MCRLLVLADPRLSRQPPPGSGTLVPRTGTRAIRRRPHECRRGSKARAAGAIESLNQVCRAIRPEIDIRLTPAHPGVGKLWPTHAALHDRWIEAKGERDPVWSRRRVVLRNTRGTTRIARSSGGATAGAAAEPVGYSQPRRLNTMYRAVEVTTMRSRASG